MALVAFLIAALAIVVLMFVTSFTVAQAQDSTVARLQANAPTVKRWGGLVLIAVGLWFMALAIFADFFARIFPV
ncbi:hypothetical protein BH24ACT15_BH24ACT15_17650 [soil metagenome]